MWTLCLNIVFTMSTMILFDILLSIFKSRRKKCLHWKTPGHLNCDLFTQSFDYTSITSSFILPISIVHSCDLSFLKNLF